MVVSSCQSPSLPPRNGSSCGSMLLTALHTRKQRPASATCAGYREQSNRKTSIDCAVGLGGLQGLELAGLLPVVSRVTIPQHRAVTCSTTNGRAIFDKYLTQGTVAQMSRRLAHFADEQQVQDVPAERLASSRGKCEPVIRRAVTCHGGKAISTVPLSSKNRRLGATRLPTKYLGRPREWPGNQPQRRCELVMRRVSGNLEKWRGASSLSQDLTRILVRIGAVVSCADKGMRLLAGLSWGTACGRRPTPTAEITNMTSRRFQ